MKSERKQTFTQGIIVLLFSQIIVKIFGIIYKLYLTNKAGFGDAGNAIYNSGFQIYALLLTISSVGVPNAISKLISEKLSIGNNRGAKKIFYVAFALFSMIGFLSSILLFTNAKKIAQYILEIPEAELTLQALAPSIFFVSIISVCRGYFNANKNMNITANSQLIEQFSKSLLTIIIVEFLYRHIKDNNKTAIMAAGANLATTIATMIGTIYVIKHYKTTKINTSNYIQSKKYISDRERIYTIIKNIFIVSMPMTITAILGGINKNIDSITVVRGLKTFLNIEQAKIEYGILSGKIDTIITLPMSFNIALTTSLVPAIAAAKSIGDIKSIETKSKFAIFITILIGLPCTVGIMIFANQILRLLFPNASSGGYTFQISAISIIFILLNQTITGILQGIGKQFVPVCSLLIGMIVKLILNLILVPIDPKNFVLGGTAGAAFRYSLLLYNCSINKYVLLKKICKT